jgi:hypothetical protein
MIPLTLVLCNSWFVLRMTLKMVSLGSPAGVPSVMQITSRGFCRAFCLAGPMSIGPMIFWSREVPNGVRPGIKNEGRVASREQRAAHE